MAKQFSDSIPTNTPQSDIPDRRDAAVFIVAVATIATASLVFLLSLRLRRREIDTIGKIGGGRWHVASMLLAEIVIVLILGGALAAGLTALTWRYGSAIVESAVMS